MRELLNSRLNFDLFKYSLKRNRGLLIVFTLLFSVAFPAIVFVNALSKSSAPISKFEIETFMVFISIVLIILLILTPFIFFNYLNSKKSVDVYHSLSITRSDLFITFLALSLFFVLVPFTIAYWGGFLLTYYTTSVQFDLAHLLHYGRLLMVAIAIMAPSVFVIMNTGTLSDSLVYTGILIIAPFIAYGAYQLFAEVNIVGFESGEAFTVAYLSPLAGLFSSFEFFNENVDGHLISSYWLLFGVAMNCFAMNLYKLWDSEASEEPFSNNKFFPFVTSIFIGILFVFLLSINFIPNPDWKFISLENLLIPIIFTYALFLILNIIKNRSINTVKIASRNYIILFIALMLFTSTLHYTQGFGYPYRIPKEKDINSIKINAEFLGEPFLSTQEYFIDDSNTIKEVLEIHDNLADFIKIDKNMFIEDAESETLKDHNIYNVSDSYGSFKISYNLKNNDTLNRRFNIPIELQHLFFDLSDSKEIIHGNHPISNPEIRLTDDISVYDALFTEELKFDFALRDQEFRTAIENDLLAMDQTSYYHSDTPIQMTVIYSYNHFSYQLNVDGRFKETLEFLHPDNIKNRQEVEGTHYEIKQAKTIKNNWLGHGISQTIQQGMHRYYGDYEPTSSSVPEKYRNKIYDKRLSKETNNALIIDTFYGRVAYPIIKD